MTDKLHPIVELPEFIRRSEELLDGDSRKALIDSLASDPTQGEKVPGTGGFRKIRWARTGGGKSGGVRVISFFSGVGMPVFLITIFGKNQKRNLSKAERSELNKFGKMIIAEFRKRRSP